MEKEFLEELEGRVLTNIKDLEEDVIKRQQEICAQEYTDSNEFCYNADLLDLLARTAKTIQDFRKYKKEEAE